MKPFDLGALRAAPSAETRSASDTFSFARCRGSVSALMTVLASPVTVFETETSCTVAPLVDVAHAARAHRRR